MVFLGSGLGLDRTMLPLLTHSGLSSGQFYAKNKVPLEMGAGPWASRPRRDFATPGLC